MDIPPDALGFAIVVATIVGTAFGVKLLVWGKGPLKGIRAGRGGPVNDARLIELEDRVEQLSDTVRDQAEVLAEYQARLDFTERLLERHKGDEAASLAPPRGQP